MVLKKAMDIIKVYITCLANERNDGSRENYSLTIVVFDV